MLTNKLFLFITGLILPFWFMCNDVSYFIQFNATIFKFVICLPHIISKYFASFSSHSLHILYFAHLSKRKSLWTVENRIKHFVNFGIIELFLSHEPIVFLKRITCCFKYCTFLIICYSIREKAHIILLLNFFW